MGKAFGELAILYNCKRTASIKGKIILDFWPGVALTAFLAAGLQPTVALETTFTL